MRKLGEFADVLRRALYNPPQANSRRTIDSVEYVLVPVAAVEAYLEEDSEPEDVVEEESVDEPVEDSDEQEESEEEEEEPIFDPS